MLLILYNLVPKAFSSSSLLFFFFVLKNGGACGALYEVSFSIRMFFRLGIAGRCCVAIGSIFLCAVLFLCSINVFLSENLTSERCFATVLARGKYCGYTCDLLSICYLSRSLRR